MLVAREPAERWADAAHTIKGAALGIGANSLAEACRICEARGRSETPPSETEAALLINDIRDVLYPTLETVAKIIHEISVSGSFRAS
jgi:HPt (histidine-containing phosphotransfer) domain-containing protein